MPRLPALILLLASAASAASPSLALRARVEPAAEHHYAGQRVRLVLEAEAHGAEVVPRGLAGLPDPDWARQVAEAELEGERGVRDGQTVHIWRYAIDYQLLAPGEHSFAPALRGTLAMRSERGSGPAMFFSTSVERPASAQASPIALDVSAPPEPAPDDFCGLVGDVRLTAAIDPAEASPGDLVNLRWSLEGIADFDGFRPPSVAAPDGLFRSYPPKTDTAAGTRDRADVAQVFVPLSLAATNVPALSVTVFDPVAGAYRALRAGPFPLVLRERPAEEPEELPVPAAAPKADAGAGPSGAPPGPAPGDPPGRLVLPAAAVGRLAPASTALRLRAFPAGAAVRIRERSGAWLRVEAAGGPSAWIPDPGGVDSLSR